MLMANKSILYFFLDVDLNVFANFNKLSALTTDTSRIAKALQRSTVLKVYRKMVQKFVD